MHPARCSTSCVQYRLFTWTTVKRCEAGQLASWSVWLHCIVCLTLCSSTSHWLRNQFYAYLSWGRACTKPGLNGSILSTCISAVMSKTSTVLHGPTLMIDTDVHGLCPAVLASRRRVGHIGLESCWACVLCSTWGGGGGHQILQVVAMNHVMKSSIGEILLKTIVLMSLNIQLLVAAESMPSLAT